MNSADLLLAASWIIPVEPAGTTLHDHAIVIRDGRILDILPVAEARTRYRAREEIDRPGHVLIPGLVNAHTHAAMTLFRGLADDLPLADWLGQHIWPAEGRWASPELVREGTELALLEMVRGGTTCFADMYYFPDVAARAAAAHGVRACVGMIVIEQPTAWAQNIDEYLSKGLAVHDQFRDHPLIDTCFAPHAPYSVSDATLRQVRVLADEIDAVIHMHVHETAEEVSTSLHEHGQRPLNRLHELGLVGPQLMAVHMTQLEDTDIELLASSGASIIHCPESSMKLAAGACPVGRLLAAGINVALGTDGAASNNDLDMFGEMRTATLLGKLIAGDPTAVTAEDALRMATLNGARALAMDSRIGSLVAGKAADIVAVDLRAPATQPVHNPLSQLIYSAGRDQVSDVWVAGRQLLAEGRHLLADVPQILARAAAWPERLRS